MGKVKEYILDIIHLNNDYTSTGMYMGIYFCMLLLMYLYSRERRYKTDIVYPAVTMLFTIYIALPFIKVFAGLGLDALIGPRTFWALLPMVVIAFGFVMIVSGVTSERKQFIAVLAVVAVLALSGEFKINNNVFPKAENLYKLPQELLDISDEVLKNGKVTLIVPYETAHVFRQYSSDIHLLYGEDATILRVYPASYDSIIACEQMQTEAPDLNFIKDIAKENEVDYIVFDSVYHSFGGHNLNFGGYTEQADFAGNRSATEEFKKITQDVAVIDDGDDIYWDLSDFNLKYVGTYGQYLLYRFVF